MIAVQGGKAEIENEGQQSLKAEDWMGFQTQKFVYNVRVRQNKLWLTWEVQGWSIHLPISQI